MRQTRDLGASSQLSGTVPVNRKERRRLAAQTRQPAPTCSCCHPKAGQKVAPDSENPM